MRRLAAVLVAPALAVALAACGDDPFRKLPRPEGASSDTTAMTTAPELSKVVLPAVPGETTTTVDRGPGRATLEGVVVGPDGGAGGATVRLERLVGDAVVRSDVATGPDGTWRAERIKGGRYRVRAFRSPDLAQARAEVLLLGGDETRRLDLRVDGYGGLTVTSAVAPTPPLVGSPANLVVRAVRRSVDADGFVRTQPLAGVSVELFGSGSWALTSPNPATTDGRGNAEFGLTCRTEGLNPLSALVDGVDRADLDLPSCERPAPSTTTTTTRGGTTSSTSSSSTTSTSSTTTSSSTSTSTTAPPDAAA